MDGSAVRGVVFDAVGTLMFADPPVASIYTDVGHRFGSRKTVEQVAAAFRRAFQAVEEADRAGNLSTSERREQRRWREIVADVLDDADDPEACFESLYAHFARPQAWRLYADAEEVLARLLDAGWLVGILSNFDARLEGICRAHRLLSQCRPVATSAALGLRKPHPAVFRAVERCTGLAPNALLHVGDDLYNDYYGARAAGWQSVLLLRQGAVATPNVPAVKSLEQLLGPLAV